ncbi:uncharacterized protein [Apostichopus japonicus]|uniref:uncharacterized protein n=1 Tax=Stichopus japonicus TaxID=307972 RepID=UPI003AB2C1C3
MEGLGLSSEIQNCTLTTVTCQPGCLIGSTVLVLLGLFHLCLGASLALLSTRITRKHTITDNMIMPLWAMPTSSDYYGDFYMNNRPAPTTNQKRIAQQDLQVAIQEHNEDHEPPEVSSFSSKKHTDDDRFVFP